MSEIISILEKEMQDIVEINKEDKEVEINDVKIWFFETEKLIRVTANLSLDSTAQQAINQLRYAAHHILKGSNQENIIEAYKHCKRAYYDTLDLFILTLNDKFNTTLIYVENLNKRKDIAEQLKEILINIQSARFDCNSRIEYYKTIQSYLVEGLKLLEILSVSVSEKPQNSEQIITTLDSENRALRQKNDENQKIIEKNLQREGANITKKGYILAILLALATFLGLLFQGSMTDYFRNPITKIQHSLESDILNTPNIIHSINPIHSIGKK